MSHIIFQCCPTTLQFFSADVQPGFHTPGGFTPTNSSGLPFSKQLHGWKILQLQWPSKKSHGKTHEKPHDIQQQSNIHMHQYFIYTHMYTHIDIIHLYQALMSFPKQLLHARPPVRYPWNCRSRAPTWSRPLGGKTRCLCACNGNICKICWEIC